MSFVFSDLFRENRSYRPGEVARRLGVHVDTVRRWADEGKIGCFRVSGHRRIPYIAIKDFVDLAVPLAKKMPQS
jgi:excisionase family DNA binding protein